MGRAEDFFEQIRQVEETAVSLLAFGELHEQVDVAVGGGLVTQDRSEQRQSGHAEGATCIELTLQAAGGSAYPRLAHVAVPDASQLRIKLDDYEIGGRFGHVVHRLVGQLPLRKVEHVINGAIQSTLSRIGRAGWDVGGGVISGAGAAAAPAASRAKRGRAGRSPRIRADI